MSDEQKQNDEQTRVRSLIEEAMTEGLSYAEVLAAYFAHRDHPFRVIVITSACGDLSRSEATF
jgi:hypothetical protein